MKVKPIIVYIHFSNRIDYYLINSIKYSRLNAPDTRIFLYSNNPGYIKYLKDTLVIFKFQKFAVPDNVLDYYVLNHNDKIFDRSFFWLKSVIRFYTLLDITSNFPETPIVHIESDSFLSIPFDEMVLYLNSLEKDMYVPVDSENRVIPSIVFLNNDIDVDNYRKAINSILDSRKKVDDFFLNDQIIFSILYQLFPRVDYFPSNKTNYTIDPGYIGQYLFGVDPRHNLGFIRPGYVRNLEDSAKLRFHSFSTNLNSTPFNLTFSDRSGNNVRVLNIHNHSKQSLDRFVNDLEAWDAHLQKINRGTFKLRFSFWALTEILRNGKLFSYNRRNKSISRALE
jgi:hypothetical protein